MSALDPAAHRRLQSSLALLDSNHDGEVMAAVAAVKRILVKAGHAWDDWQQRFLTSILNWRREMSSAQRDKLAEWVGLAEASRAKRGGGCDF